MRPQTQTGHDSHLDHYSVGSVLAPKSDNVGCANGKRVSRVNRTHNALTLTGRTLPSSVGFIDAVK